MLRNFVRHVLREAQANLDRLFNVSATAGEREEIPNISFIISLSGTITVDQIRDSLWLELYEAGQHELTHIVQDHMLELADDWKFEMPPAPATPAYYRYEKEVEAFVSGLSARAEKSPGSADLASTVKEYLMTQVRAGFLDNREVEDITKLWLEMVDNLPEMLEASKRASAKYIADTVFSEIGSLKRSGRGEFVTSLLIVTDSDDTGEDIPLLVNYVFYKRH